MSPGRSALSVQAAGLEFQNPIVLAAGTAAYGQELADVIDLAALGGLVTKAVSPEPRAGAPAPRVAEFGGGMINAVGLANPGVAAVRSDHLPWLSRSLPNVRKLANIVGFTIPEFAGVIEQLEASLSADAPGALDGYEINVSCPNVKAGGMEFGADPDALAQVVRLSRAATARPLFVKLSPTLPDIARSAQIAVDAGADGLTLVNTIPGLVIDVERRRPALGFGTGGVSGTALLPVGVLATWKVRRVARVPLIGIGGVSTAEDALQYLIAGATLVGIGTAMLRDPRTPERVVEGLSRWCARHGVARISDVIGTLEGP
ncbi:MAG TPA: dihydroorotate dehydrogenase [Gemmatimonadaceae bacterium]|nr:dihydroorotate dehydrogenase [Gemmatimonadaceae bacterium]